MCRLGERVMSLTELQKERADLLNACSTGDDCGKNLEKYYNNCCDLKTGLRCCIAQLLDANKLRMKWYEVDGK